MDDGSFNIRHWVRFFEESTRGNLALQLVSDTPPGRDTNPHVSHGSVFHRDTSAPEPPVHMEYSHPAYGVFHSRENKFMYALNYPGFSVFPGASGTHTIPMPQPPEPPKEEKALPMDEHDGHSDVPLKKRSRDRTIKHPKQKKPKKANDPEKDDTSNGLISRAKTGKKNTGMVINGIDLDLSGIPTPVCSCTGSPQQCYKWGAGGWQSACCTISISQYPLPMGSKRKGARIAGRKMSQGAFKKVLEGLAGEGRNLSSPIDLKAFWARHGTNKFVIIR